MVAAVVRENSDLVGQICSTGIARVAFQLLFNFKN